MNREHYLAKLVAFMNAPHFLAFMRELTGMEAIHRTDAQATLYRPGDFLTVHDDKTGGHKRLAAYVLNHDAGLASRLGRNSAIHR